MKKRAKPKTTKAKPKAKPASKPAATKASASTWGEGPWAQPKPKAANTKSLLTPLSPMATRPELEDVFNHKVRQAYLPKPGEWRQFHHGIQTPKAVWAVRAVLITIAVLVWLVALFHPFK